MLATVNRHSRFSAECRPWQQTHQRAIDERAIFAAVMGLGCGIGVSRMARIAQGISETEIDRAANWHLSLENVQAANDRIIGVSANLELPEIYRREPERLHTASDGQKFAVRRTSLNASHSFKYFGKGQGVSAYAFIDERQLLWHSLVMSAAERESAYVVDGLMRNDVVRSDIHSTDSHGYAEAIFAVTHLLGISYAPRIKNIGDQRLYGFRSRAGGDRTRWAIVPDKLVREDLIHARWDDVLRLVATIKLKETTASDIFRRLNSYAKQHELYRALKTFGQIVKTLFVLRYVDEIELRQAIERQLSRIELAHRFTRNVAVGNPREFEQTNEGEPGGCRELQPTDQERDCVLELPLLRAPAQGARRSSGEAVADRHGRSPRDAQLAPREHARRVRLLRRAPAGLLRTAAPNPCRLTSRLCRVTYLYAEIPSVRRSTADALVERRGCLVFYFRVAPSVWNDCDRWAADVSIIAAA